MVRSWPQWVVNSFVSVNQPQYATDESAYYGPYVRFLGYLFGLDGPFEIDPQYHVPRTLHDSIDIAAVYVVKLRRHPIFFMEIKAPASFTINARRKDADHQMRKRIRSLRHEIVTPRLLGISAFGTRLSFYEYVRATDTLTPPAIPRSTFIANDVAPAERWSYELLEADGITRMRQVVKDVKAMLAGPSRTHTRTRTSTRTSTYISILNSTRTRTSTRISTRNKRKQTATATAGPARPGQSSNRAKRIKKGVAGT